MTYRELYTEGKKILEEAAVPDAELDARLLLEHVCGTGRSQLLVYGDRNVDEDREAVYRELLKKRSRRVPLQYLTGTQNFMGLDFEVNGDVLIPRQDTEILAEEVLKYLHDGMSILDMGTGSGCILISLLHYSNNCQGTGADISEAALAVAERNAGCLLGKGIDRDNREADFLGEPFSSNRGDGASDREAYGGLGGIRFVKSNLFDRIEGKFDVIVSNPPYIRRNVIPGLMPEVRDYEPVQALDGGEDGLDFYREITKECREHLFGGGMLFFEIGYDQGEAVSGLMEQAGFLEIQVVKDYAGLDRVVYGTLGMGCLK